MTIPTPENTSAPAQARPRRALFVDIDGVFHPTTHSVASTAASVDTVHFGWVPYLDQALRGHDDVVLVMHSTWRNAYSVEELRDLLGVLGPRVFDKTPVGGQRFESIRWWLYMKRQFSDYRILDDEPKEFGDPLPPELIVCDPSTGVSAPGVLQALREWLGEAKT